MRALMGAVLALWLLGTPLTVAAASLGVDITTNGVAGTNPVDFTIGWAVDVTTPVRVTALGVWDEGSNGLLVSHAVGLWTGAGTLLASSTVPAGTGADTAVPSVLGTGRWLFEDIADVVLPAGHYVLGSTSNGDDFRAFQGGIILDPALANFDSARFAIGPILQFPGLDGSPDLDIGLFGPNLLLEPVAAPAPLPAPLVLVALGLGLLRLGARYTRRRAA